MRNHDEKEREGDSLAGQKLTNEATKIVQWQLEEKNMTSSSS